MELLIHTISSIWRFSLSLLVKEGPWKYEYYVYTIYDITYHSDSLKINHAWSLAIVTIIWTQRACLIIYIYIIGTLSLRYVVTKSHISNSTMGDIIATKILHTVRSKLFAFCCVLLCLGSSGLYPSSLTSLTLVGYTFAHLAMINKGKFVTRMAKS